MKAQWQKLKRAHVFREITDDDVQACMRGGTLTEAQVRAELERELADNEYWVNDLYQVCKRKLYHDDGTVGAYHLNIRRRDGRAIFRDWRHFQWIKNQLVGEENEGLEIYPAESRLSDTSNKYHLWVFADPEYRIPFGMWQRDVLDDDGNRTPGYRQRAL